jgi:hypothetical protein
MKKNISGTFGGSVQDTFGQQKVPKTHSGSPRAAASPLAIRNNPGTVNRDPTGTPQPHTAIEFAPAIAAAPSRRRTWSPSRGARPHSSPPRRGFMDSSNKENQ